MHGNMDEEAGGVQPLVLTETTGFSNWISGMNSAHPVMTCLRAHCVHTHARPPSPLPPHTYMHVCTSTQTYTHKYTHAHAHTTHTPGGRMIAFVSWQASCVRRKHLTWLKGFLIPTLPALAPGQLAAGWPPNCFGQSGSQRPACSKWCKCFTLILVRINRWKSAIKCVASIK